MNGGAGHEGYVTMKWRIGSWYVVDLYHKREGVGCEYSSSGFLEMEWLFCVPVAFHSAVSREDVRIR